jgi:RNA polymerase sigma-70 factor (sigma-E family)
MTYGIMSAGRASPADTEGSRRMTDTEDFAAFVRGRTPALLRSAFLLTGDQHLAEDLVQASLARTHRAWRRLDRLENAESYTRRVMYHLQVSWWRRHQVAESVTADPPEPSGRPVDATAAADLRLAVAAALLRLSPKQRAILVLRFFEDHTAVETAELLGMPIGTVKSQTFRALARLRAVAPELADVQFEEGSSR